MNDTPDNARSKAPQRHWSAHTLRGVLLINMVAVGLYGCWSILQGALVLTGVWDMESTALLSLQSVPDTVRVEGVPHMRIDRFQELVLATSDPGAVALIQISDAVFCLLLIALHWQLFRFVTEASSGRPFMPAVPRYLRRTAALIFLIELSDIALERIGTHWFWPDIAALDPRLTASWDLDLGSFAICLFLLVFAHVIDAGVHIQQEQDLTV
jgi:cytochrome b561